MCGRTIAKVPIRLEVCAAVHAFTSETIAAIAIPRMCDRATETKPPTPSTDACRARFRLCASRESARKVTRRVPPFDDGAGRENGILRHWKMNATSSLATSASAFALAPMHVCLMERALHTASSCASFLREIASANQRLTPEMCMLASCDCARRSTVSTSHTCCAMWIAGDGEARTSAACAAMLSPALSTRCSCSKKGAIAIRPTFWPTYSRQVIWKRCQKAEKAHLYHRPCSHVPEPGKSVSVPVHASEVRHGGDEAAMMAATESVGSRTAV